MVSAHDSSSQPRNPASTKAHGYESCAVDAQQAWLKSPTKKQPLFVDPQLTCNKMDTRPGKQPHKDGKSSFFMGKLTISMAIFHSYVKLPEGSICQQVPKLWDL